MKNTLATLTKITLLTIVIIIIASAIAIVAAGMWANSLPTCKTGTTISITSTSATTFSTQHVFGGLYLQGEKTNKLIGSDTEKVNYCLAR